MRTLSTLLLILLISVASSAQDAPGTIRLLGERACMGLTDNLEGCDIESGTKSIDWNENGFIIIVERDSSDNTRLELVDSETLPTGGTRQTYHQAIENPFIRTRISIERLAHPASLADGYEYSYIVTSSISQGGSLGGGLIGGSVFYANAVTSNETSPPQEGAVTTIETGPPQQGTGTYTDDNGTVCTGELKEGKMDGHGICTFADGNVYDGQWQDGMRHGRGTTTTASDGAESVGPWSMNQRDGTFIVTYPTGRVVQAEYEQGSLLGEAVVLSEPPFEGIGISFGREEESDRLIVTLVGDLMPAARAGVRVSDILHSADGILLDGKSNNEVINLIAGPAGTIVRLGVLRGEELILLDVQRGTIDPASFETPPPPPQPPPPQQPIVSQPDPDLPPAVDAVVLSEGFSRLDAGLRVSPGGSVEVDLGGCTYGYVGSAPDVNVTYETSGGTDLSFDVGREGSAPMLLVRTPAGTWRCDNLGGQMGPFDTAPRSRLVIPNAEGGEYNIWLGNMYDSDVMASAWLYISEN